jgi:hypothetical protein
MAMTQSVPIARMLFLPLFRVVVRPQLPAILAASRHTLCSGLSRRAEVRHVVNRESGKWRSSKRNRDCLNCGPFVLEPATDEQRIWGWIEDHFFPQKANPRAEEVHDHSVRERWRTKDAARNSKGKFGGWNIEGQMEDPR